jgi:peroxiredoxin (alkyl hydroperoxide reductase subunit C)
MQNLQKQMADLEGTDTQVLGVSMDSPFANKAFADSIGVTFPIASDWFNDGAATKAFGAYNERTRAARRVNYLIDKSGKVAEMQVDSEAIDPTKIVNACKARRLKE